jgi:ubiquinone/menaquinone biosynthesis C-methylase UbiE
VPQAVAPFTLAIDHKVGKNLQGAVAGHSHFPMHGPREEAMPAHEHWQMDASAPELYERYLVPAITSLWADDLLDRIGLERGESVLDIACGTGVVARLAQQRGHVGRLVGIDLNTAMLAIARQKSASIEWIEGSALNLPFNSNSFDAVLCQLGLQFFPDRPLALKEMARVLKPGGRAALSVYSAIERTPAAYFFVLSLEKYLGEDASRTKRSEHLSCDAQEVGAWAKQAGFDDVDVANVTKQITFPSMTDYVRFQLTATPMAALLNDKGGPERERLIMSIAADAASRLDHSMLANGKLTFPQESFVLMASLH